MRWSLFEFLDSTFLLWSAIFSLPWEKRVTDIHAYVFWCSASAVVAYQRYEEGVFEAERRGDGEDGVQAAQQSPEQDQLAYVRLYGKAGQVEPQRR